jgi:hypothetical protein
MRGYPKIEPLFQKVDAKRLISTGFTGFNRMRIVFEPRRLEGREGPIGFLFDRICRVYMIFVALGSFGMKTKLPKRNSPEANKPDFVGRKAESILHAARHASRRSFFRRNRIGHALLIQVSASAHDRQPSIHSGSANRISMDKYYEKKGLTCRRPPFLRIVRCKTKGNAL